MIRRHKTEITDKKLQKPTSGNALWPKHYFINILYKPKKKTAPGSAAPKSSYSKNESALVRHLRIENHCCLGDRHCLDGDVAGTCEGCIEETFTAEENVCNALNHLNVHCNCGIHHYNVTCINDLCLAWKIGRAHV